MNAMLKWATVGLALLSAGSALAQDGNRGGDRRQGAGNPQVTRPLIRPYGPVIRQPVIRPGPPEGRRPAPPRRHVFVPLGRFPAWTPAFPYAASFHDTCQRKAWRLRWFERNAVADGYLTASERYELSALRRDLRRNCGDWRWRD